MKDYQRAFLDFAIEAGAIKFGEFVLKSQRVSPYFFNAGCFSSGSSLLRLGQFYATAIIDAGVAFDMLFGLAYKGIPLAATTAIALASEHHRDVPYAFNRKKAKDYAEGGVIVGAPLRGNVLIVDDVISAGQSVAEAIGLIKQAGATSAGAVIALDRQERGVGTRSAVQDVETSYAIQVIRIVSLDTLVTYLAEREEVQHHLAAITAYRRRYGV
ncbi:MAG: orotate phosphoribosyltransferase [Acidiferrobacterales bacterium]